MLISDKRLFLGFLSLAAITLLCANPVNIAHAADVPVPVLTTEELLAANDADLTATQVLQKKAAQLTLQQQAAQGNINAQQTIANQQLTAMNNAQTALNQANQANANLTAAQTQYNNSLATLNQAQAALAAAPATATAEQLADLNDQVNTATQQVATNQANVQNQQNAVAQIPVAQQNYAAAQTAYQASLNQLNTTQAAAMLWHSR